MADISKCKNSNCPIKSKCYRFTSVADTIMQSYSDWQFTIKNNHVFCDGFWGDSNRILDQLKNIVKGNE